MPHNSALMKKILLLIILFISGACFAQQDAWVYFANKPDADFYLNNPLRMLSQKSLNRRAAQGIITDEKDVPQHQPYIQQVTTSRGITVIAKSKWLNALHVRGTVDDINALRSLPGVDHINFANKTLNPMGRSAGRTTVTASGRMDRAAAEFDYGASAGQVVMLNGHLLHRENYTGAGITIAVMDAGFPATNTLPTFERLRSNSGIRGGYNFVGRSDNYYTGGTHGTQVLSTMAGYTEGQLVGTAPDASYYLFITEDTSGENPLEESLWVEAAEMADSLGVDIINTSLGYFTYDNPDCSYTYQDINGETSFITRGANIAFTRGMLCVISAGNSGATENSHISVPADAYNALTVGAVNSARQIAPFSSIGPTYDMRIKPDVAAQGVATVHANVDGTISGGNGTSYSSPVTAGLVACLWQALPGKTNTELLQLIRESADRYNNPTAQYGYGIPDFYRAMQRGLNLPQDQQPFLLYPNPSAGMVYLRLPADVGQASVLVFNSLGQLILKSTVLVGEPFSIQDMAEGFYTYRVEAGGKNYTGKLIKK
jgi:serine protease AprX